MKKRPGHRWVTFLLPIVLVAFCFGGYYLCLHLPFPHRGSTSADIVHSEYRFGDVNKTHLSAARKNGIKPVAEREDIPTEGLTRIESGKQYMVGHLAHSSPYLTPAAAELLDEIAVRFQAALKEQGLEKHRIIVTSVLRTGSDVKRLREVNENASANSAHQYATTFDIPYVRYDRQSLFGKAADNEKLANILGETLKQLRDEGRCYVKYETRQRCFHITSRK